MKARPIQRLCEDHGLPQLFARPRTHNDNPFIESAFSTVKRAPEYPGRFLDDGQAETYFARYFTWYDTEHYHSGIDYVTPQQAHQGLRPQIVAQRQSKKPFAWNDVKSFNAVDADYTCSGNKNMLIGSKCKVVDKGKENMVLVMH